MPTKNRNRRRRQNQKKAKQQKRKEAKQTPSQVVRHQATDQRHPFNDLPDDIVKLILQWKKEMETWTVTFNNTLKTFHDIHIQAKAVHGLMLLPQMGDAPPWVRDGVISGAEFLQEMSDQWLTILVETYICTEEAVVQCAALQEHMQELKDSPHPAFALICRKALEQHKWSDFKQTLPIEL
jgi:hypothetical protein